MMTIKGEESFLRAQWHKEQSEITRALVDAFGGESLDGRKRGRILQGEEEAGMGSSGLVFGMFGLPRGILRPTKLPFTSTFCMKVDLKELDKMRPDFVDF
jgi:hypothetical protein